MFKKLPYDTVKSFEPVIITHVVPLMLVVNNDLPVKNLKELIAYGKANPGKLSFASSGPAARRTCPGELFKSMTGIEMTHVPYKGSTAAHPDLMGGQTSLMFDTVAAVQPHVKSGKLRAIAVTTAKRACHGAGRADDGRGWAARLRYEHLGDGVRSRRNARRTS